MSHCALGPGACSQCARVEVQRVEVVDGIVVIDGVATRPAQPEMYGAHQNTRAGAARRARRRR